MAQAHLKVLRNGSGLMLANSSSPYVGILEYTLQASDNIPFLLLHRYNQPYPPTAPICDDMRFSTAAVRFYQLVLRS